MQLPPPPSLPDEDPSARAAATAVPAAGVREAKQDPFGLPKDEWLAAARLGKVRARAAADAAASLPPPPPPPPQARAPSLPAAAPALSPPQPPPLSPGRGRYLAPLTMRAPLPFAAAAAADDEAAAAPTSLPRPPPLSMEEIQRQQEELAAASRQQQQQRATRTTRSSRSALSQGPRSLMLVGAGNPARPGEAGGAFDAAAALLLRRGKGGEKKKPGGTFNIANGGLPSSSDPASARDSAAAAASLAAAAAAREAGEAARARSAGTLAPAAAAAGGGAGGLPRWRERHGAAGVDAGDRRSSAIVECGLLLAECVRARLRTLAFCKTRKLAELVAAHASQRLRELEERGEKEGGAGGSSGSKKRSNAATAAAETPNSPSSPQQLPPLSSRVAAYRAGYDPRARRAIEGALASGRVLGVAATNALELGIDLPLEVTLHLGLPARAATLAQQSGRAGRFGSASLHVAIAFDGPLDQWYVRHPERFFGRAPEPAGGGFDPWADSALAALPSSPSPENGRAAAAAAVSRTRKVDEGILALHVACAAAECPPLDPTPEGDDARLYFGPRLPAVAAGLVAAGALVGGDWWSGSGSGRSQTGAKNNPSSSSSRGAGGRARAAAEAVVAKGTPLFFAGVVAGSGNGGGALLAPSSALAPPSRSLSSLPHSTFGLRAIDETRFSIVDDASGALLEEMEASKAFFVV